ANLRFYYFSQNFYINTLQMTKNRNVLLAFLAAVLVLTACQNLEKILPKNTGTWNAVSGSVTVLEDGVAITTDSTVSVTGVTYQFNDDGSGEYTEDGQTSSFTWSYDEENEQITTTESGTSITYDVLDYTNKTMTLFFPFEIDFFGIMLRTESTINLERAE
ncbi:MAG: hypothetical protein AAFN10_14660, partial [Bacteroidota bacterium]